MRSVPGAATVRVVNDAPVEIHTEAGMGRREFAAAPDRLWAALPAVFEELSIPVNMRNTSELQMGNAGFQTRRVGDKRMSTYLDCGSTLAGRLADIYDVTLMVLVRLTATSDGGTAATTYVDATAKSRSVSGNAVHCQSRGGLEQRVADLVAEQLVGDPGGT